MHNRFQAEMWDKLVSRFISLYDIIQSFLGGQFHGIVLQYAPFASLFSIYGRKVPLFCYTLVFKAHSKHYGTILFFLVNVISACIHNTP